MVGVRAGLDSHLVLLMCRFDVPPADADAFLARGRRALELLTAAPGCLGGELGRAIEEPGRWVLQVRFASVDGYRRALSPFPVREHVVPLLAEALADEPATFETLASGAGGAVTAHESLLASSQDPAGGSAPV
ncbi:antibiotic biosynthesis monooxygenase [Pseudonocardia sp. N23]|uniref:antibiotic biosynthesis monooxygenase family protein n=1 Tax=Pseudonocardia sp. N23 TaxID=1987376 RepID=UPI000BFDCABE|nr:antibiotic biosynthesis monooxygenase family protein [Pseudonocardia sp. N23]